MNNFFAMKDLLGALTCLIDGKTMQNFGCRLVLLGLEDHLDIYLSPPINFKVGIQKSNSLVTRKLVAKER